MTLDSNLQIRNLVLKLFLKIDFAMYSPTKIHWQNHTTSLIIGNYSLWLRKADNIRIMTFFFGKSSLYHHKIDLSHIIGLLMRTA